MSVKLTPNSAMKIAKELTVKALENGYIPKSTDAESVATTIADFYIKLATKLCDDDSTNARIHLEQ